MRSPPSHPPPPGRHRTRCRTADGDRPRAGRVTLRFTPDEAAKHGIEPAPFIEIVDDPGDDVDLCIVLGGDGTILTALRRYAGTGVPVFAVNYGEVGFLATIDPDGLERRLRRARSPASSTRSSCPTISVGRPDGTWSALNDISVHRKAGLRVADLAYALAGEEIGRVRCDGLVVATPQGSTGYNLANGGPVLAWGVEGYVVSFIAPHSLTARALVVAPGDELTINNASREEPVEVHVDGRPDARAPARRGHPRRVRPHARHAGPDPGRVASTTACASASAAWRAACLMVTRPAAVSMRSSVPNTAPMLRQICVGTRRLPRSVGPHW